MPKKQRDGVVAVSMDMWEAFINSTRDNVKQADIVHDKCHIVSDLNDAVNDVRKKEHAMLSEQKIDVLKGTRFLWLKRPERMTDDQKERFKALNKDQFAVGRAWNLKELFRHFWDYCTATDIERKPWKDTKSMRDIFMERSKAAKLPYFPPKAFRSSAVLLALDFATTGKEIKAISQCFGHEFVATKLACYGNLTDDKLIKTLKGISFQKKNPTAKDAKLEQIAKILQDE